MSSLAPIQPQRVVVTGIGMASALGFEVEEYWTALLAGRCGLRVLTNIPGSLGLPTLVGGQIPNELLQAALPRYNITDADRINQLGLYVVGRALEDAGWPTDGQAPLAIDMIMGTGHGNVAFHNEAVKTFVEGGYRKIRPTTVVRIMFNRPANIASIRYRLTGGSHTVSCACASASVAFGEAYHRIRFGLTEGVVAGCCDSGFDLMSFSAWNRLGVFSRIKDPERASRPFDRARDGLIMGEGAAAFVLESWEAARRRGATVLAEVVGYGCSSDAKHIVQPDPAGQIKAVRAALASANLTPEDIDYVNAHGTGTEIADVVEAESLRQALGPRGDTVPVSNTKGQLGHLMGATSGVELVTMILAMQKGILPPCRNLEDPDPRCPLNFVRKQPQEIHIRHAMKNCFAFGGTNSVVILRRNDSLGN